MPGPATSAPASGSSRGSLGDSPRPRPSRRSAPGPRRSARDRRSGRSRGPRPCLPSRPRARGGGSRRSSAGRSTGNVAPGSRRSDAPRRDPARPSARRARGSPARSPAQRRSPGAGARPPRARRNRGRGGGARAPPRGAPRPSAGDRAGAGRGPGTGTPGSPRPSRATGGHSARPGPPPAEPPGPGVAQGHRIHGDPAGARVFEAIQEPQQGALARTRRPDQHIPPLRLELQVDTPQDFHPSAKDPDPLQPQHLAARPECLDACRRRGSCPHRTPFFLDRDVTSIPPAAQCNPIRPALARERGRASDPEVGA